jgi:exodeoxyribonuclease VII large subunit
LTLPFDFSAKFPPPPPPPEEPRALSVGELNRMIRRAVEEGFERPAWVEGEVVGARPASSGHLYFTLKDETEDAAVDVAMYKTSITARARKLIVDGARIRLRGRPTFWSPRGRLQFIADRVEPVGKGALLEALEKLKTKLAAEGLFSLERKRALPREPRIIGVVTSAGGAVIHDIVKVAFRRGGAHILLAAAQVQGAGSAESIERALRMLQRVEAVDVIIVGRGGGSSDDLGCFNEESLVRAIAACRVPVVSAVGHEVDVTLTDFAADARAATPSQAAEMVVADHRAEAAHLAQMRVRLRRAMRARVADDRARLGSLLRRMGDPRLAIASFQQTLDDRVTRLEASARALLTRRHQATGRLEQRLTNVHPRAVIDRHRSSLDRATQRLGSAERVILARHGATLEGLAGRLDAMSPLKVLARGYAIATSGGRALLAATDVKVGDRVSIRVRSALIAANVVSVEPSVDKRDGS